MFFNKKKDVSINNNELKCEKITHENDACLCNNCEEEEN